MREMTSPKLRELAADIEVELRQLAHLEITIQEVQREIAKDADRAEFFYESLALKLHNFYNGCERIFRMIASELNGTLPSDYDWHRRLLKRMSMARDGRPALITLETARQLQEYLAFRHVVRNIYGFELDPARVQKLAVSYVDVWQRFASEVGEFVDWLRTLADQLEN